MAVGCFVVMGKSYDIIGIDKFEVNGENVDEKNSKNRYNHNYVR